MINEIHTCPKCGKEKEIVIREDQNPQEIGCHCAYPSPDEYYLSPASLLANIKKEENPKI